MSGMTGSFHITTWIIWQFNLALGIVDKICMHAVTLFLCFEGEESKGSIDGRGHGRKAATTGREDCRDQKRAIKEVTCK